MLAKLQKKPAEDHSNDWLSTYSDMVTLLLTFFVMLYASSSVDEQKWQYIYQAFQSRGKYLNEYVDSPNPNATEGSYITDNDPEYSGGDGELPQSFDTLYQYLTDYVSQNNLASSISVDKGAAHITIRFANSVFFDGNSAVLKQSGKDVINGIAPGIKAVQNAIQRVTISGHTAQVLVPSEINDFELSSDRAVSVVKFMDYTKVVSTEKFRTKGCGYSEPIADNSTEDGRAKNRRVEIEIIKSNLDMTDPAVVQDILAHDWKLPTNQFDPDAENTNPTPEKLPGDAAQSIIDNIESMFPADSTSFGNLFIGPVVPSDYEQFIAVEAEDSDAEDAPEDSAAE
ncbi:MAG: flagellar motor protein MotB [Oscillospiraceae bacterium]